jgi:murein DD-endopeptidase MepM/ murein hydrolase activator NlpD
MTDSHSHSIKSCSLTGIHFLLCFFVLFTINGKGYLDTRFLQQSALSQLICREFYSPFNDSNRKSCRSIERRLIGSYGEYRKSYKPGHLHAGIDLEGAFTETVYPIGSGQVHLILNDFPHRTVILKHHLLNGEFLFSVYTHVEQVKVKIGDWVDERSALARLFDEDELERANFGTPNHLHLEIRKNTDDRGRASYASMTRQELDKFCMDPMEFFKANLKE